MKELLLGRPEPRITPGDRFIKAGDPNRKVYEVFALRTAVDGIEHARLQNCDGTITIGSGVLCDLRFWQRAQAL